MNRSRHSLLVVARFSAIGVLAETATYTTGALTSSRRLFSSDNQMNKERGFGHRLKDVPVLTGNARPVSRESGWTCRFKLSQRIEDVVPIILREHGWTEEQIQREINGLHFHKQGGNSKAALNIWSTVEEFQRTPWYRRFRPTDTRPGVYISYEALKLMELELIPPSLRVDPYAHLRKRHMEDNWLHDSFSESSAKYVCKADLDRYTKGSPTYGTITRKQFLQFEEKFKQNHGGMPQQNESYNSWMEALSRKE